MKAEFEFKLKGIHIWHSYISLTNISFFSPMDKWLSLANYRQKECNSPVINMEDNLEHSSSAMI
jgi:hypothetical protein